MARLIAGFLLGFAVFAESPADFPGCVLWLDASSVASGDGVPVAQWRDRSGYDYDATQPDANRQPTYKKSAPGASSALRFEGGDFLFTPVKRDWTGTDWTVFAVASLDTDTPATYRGIIGNRFGAGKGTWWTLGTKGDGTTYLELAAGVGVSTRVSPANSRAYVYTVVKQGQQFSLYRNGTLMGTASHADIGGTSNELRIGMWFGAGQEWQGDIAEIILCEGAIDTPERERVEGYLSEKWGVFFAQRMLIKEPTWPGTMLASRSALRAWAAKQGMTQLSDEVVAGLWDAIRAEFPAEAARFEHLAVAAHRNLPEWFRNDADCEVEKALITLGGARLKAERDALATSNAPPSDSRWLALVDEAGETRDAFLTHQRRLDGVNMAALRRAIDDLSADYPDRYVRGRKFGMRLDDLERRLPEIKAGLATCDETALAAADEILSLQQEALLSNPLLDFDELLFIRRSVKSPTLGLVQNWQSNCALPRAGFDNEIALISPVHPEGRVTTVYRPEKPVFVGDMDLNFDADRMLFSSIGSLGRWQIFEIGIDGARLRQVTPGDEPDVDNYDPCYLPDGRVMFCSTAFFAAVPCVNGSTRSANLYRMEADGSQMRQLCFDQEHNWCPTMLPDGRVLYLRWDYTDTPTACCST